MFEPLPTPAAGQPRVYVGVVDHTDGAGSIDGAPRTLEVTRRTSDAFPRAAIAVWDRLRWTDSRNGIATARRR